MGAVLRRRGDVLLLALFAVGVILLAARGGRQFAPLGVYAVGAVNGVLLALHALGLVLVYRANRVINFAQVQMSALGGLLFVSLAQRRLPLVLLDRICPPCLRDPRNVGELASAGTRGREVAEASGLTGLPPETTLAQASELVGRELDTSMFAAALAPEWLVHASYWVSLVLALALVVLLVWSVHASFVKRFTTAPRLILTIATLGAGEFALRLGSLVFSPVLVPNEGEPLVRGSVPPPTTLELHLAPATFNALDLLAVVGAVVLVGGIAWYLRRSSAGIALRAAAEDPIRASTLGFNVNQLTSRAWLLAGLLGGFVTILAAAKSGSSSVTDLSFLVRALGATVVGGFVSLPLTAVGAVVIAVLDQAVLWTTSSTAYIAGLLLLLVVALMLVRRTRASRAELESEQTWAASREIRPIPVELRDVPAVRRGRRLLAAALVTFALAYPWFMAPGQVSLAQETIVLAIIGLSLLVLTGWAGQMSLGQVAIAAVGAWVAAVTRLPFPLALIAAGVAGAAIAFVVGLPALRLRGLNLAVVTLGFAVATSALLLDGRYLGRLLPGSVPRPVLLGLDLADDRTFYYVLLVFLAAAVAAARGLRRSRTARALIATKDNELAAQSFGINLVTARLSAFAVSGVMAAVAGALLVFAHGGVEPQSFGPGRSIALFLMTIIGGVGALSGPILGAVTLNGLQLLGDTPLAPLIDLVRAGGLLVVIVLLFMPGGLAQAVFGARDSWLRRIAARERIHVPSLIADDGGGRELIPIAPKRREGTATAVVPVRYRLPGQWMDELKRQPDGAERAHV